MDVFYACFRPHEAWMRRVDEDARVRAGEVTREVPAVEDIGEFGDAVLGVCSCGGGLVIYCA